MATQVQFRRGTTSQNNAFTGAQGELTIDTEVWALRIHDGTTSGGKVVPTLTASQTLTNKTIGTNSIWNGNSIGLGYGGTGSALSPVAGAIVYSSGSAFGLSLAGTSGQVLTSGGTSGPTWVNASALSTGTATTATRATNIDGGSAGYLVYQSDTNTTDFIAPGTSGYVLRSTGASTPPAWVTSALTIGSTAVQVGDTVTDFTGLTSFYITGTTDASSSTTGVFRVSGGASIAKKLYVGSDLTVTGNLTVNGTTTNINTTNLVVEDKNIILGDVTTPSDTTADGGGITLKGATDKTLNWVDATDSWTSSEHIDVASTKTYKIATTKVLEATKLFADGQTSITIGDSATATALGATGSATLTVNPGTVVGYNTTQNLWNTTATTVNAFGSATTIGIGASTGTLTVNNAQVVFNSTSTVQLPVGTTAQRPTAATGQVRYNSDLSTFEGYAASAWGSLGGVKSVDGLTYIIPETSAGASNDELEFYTATDASTTAKRGGWNKTRLLVSTPILVGSDANLTDFPNAKIVSSTGNTGDNHAYNAGVVGEGVASGTDTDIWGVGVYGVGASNGGTKSAGVLGDGHVSATGDTGSAVGVRGYAVDTHAGGYNIGLYGNATGSGVGNYALWMESGNINSASAQTWTLYDNSSSSLSLGSTGKADIIKVITTDAAEGVTMSGTLGVTGDFKVNTDKFTVAASTGNTVVAGTLNVTGNTTLTGDLAVNGSDITTTGSGTATLFNTNALTLNMGGAATAVAIGSTSSGTTTIGYDANVKHDLTVDGDVQIKGGDLTTNQSTFNLINATATTLNIGQAATTVSIGATTGGTTINNPLTLPKIAHITDTTQSTVTTDGSLIVDGGVGIAKDLRVGGTIYAGGNGVIAGNITLTGNLTVSGTTTTTSSANAGYASTIIDLNYNSGGLSTDNGKDIGVAFDWYKSGAPGFAYLVWKNDSQKLTYYKDATISSNVVSGTLGDAEFASIKSTGLTTSASSYNLINTDATTLNIGGAATTLSIGAGTGTTTINNNLTVSGNLTVNGTTTTVNSTTITVDDKNIELGSVDTPSNTTADGGGITLKGATDKTFNWINSSSAWTSSEHLALAGGKSIILNGSTSGTLTLSGPATAGSNILNFPAATDTLVGKATTDIFTNKTYDTAGTGNSFKINGTAITAVTGTGSAVLAAAPTITGNVTLQGVTSTGATGTGAIVFGTSPSLTTPSLGVASATSVNKLTITTPATSATLTIADGTTLSTAGSVSHAGAYSQTFTATANTSLTLPTTGTLATLAGSETLTNKTLSSAVLTGTLTAGGGVGTNGQYLQSTATGVQWATLSGTISLAAGSGSGSVSTGGTLTLTGGTGITTSASSSTITITNSGVTSVSAGTGVTLGATTGACSISIGQAVATTSNVTFGTIASGALTVTGAITATGDISSNYSDDRLKTRTGKIENALEKVLSLDGFHYHANETAVALGYDASKQEIGLSAQQVNAILPEVIAPAPIDSQYMTLHYERLVPLLVEAIKEQQKQIEELKAKLGN